MITTLATRLIRPKAILSSSHPTRFARAFTLSPRLHLKQIAEPALADWVPYNDPLLPPAKKSQGQQKRRIPEHATVEE